ncbi:MAG: hypothetical protein ACKPKO_38820, partial [Candidatus Fonsibacter sp.]
LNLELARKKRMEAHRGEHDRTLGSALSFMEWIRDSRPTLCQDRCYSSVGMALILFVLGGGGA